jgi:hypothetical protein
MLPILATQRCLIFDFGLGKLQNLWKASQINMQLVSYGLNRISLSKTFCISLLISFLPSQMMLANKKV